MAATVQAWIAGTRFLWRSVVFLCLVTTQSLFGLGNVYDIPEGDAGRTLRLFAEASNQEILFSAEVVRGIRTNRVHGRMPPAEALNKLLAGTGLVAIEDSIDGAFAIRRLADVQRSHASPGNGLESNRPPDSIPPDPNQTSMKTTKKNNLLTALSTMFAAVLAPAPTSGQETPDAALDNESNRTIELSPFVVSTEQDRGYRASNSVSATRISTPIKDLPFSVTAFTGEFINDLGARSIADVLAFAPGVVPAAAEFTSGTSSAVVRGFTQGTPQRNGIASPMLIADTANLDRLEVAKGPASLLYGQIQPGGVVNYITKQAHAKRDVRLTSSLGSYRFARAVIDANLPIIPGKLYFRVNGMTENDTQYYEPYRARSHMVASSLVWEITPASTLRFEAEIFEAREDPPLSQKPVIQYTGIPNREGGAGSFFPLPRRFQYVSRNDYRNTDQYFGGIEYTHRLGDHWTARANYSVSRRNIDLLMTGIGTVNVARNGAATLIRRFRYQPGKNEAESIQMEAAGDYSFTWGNYRPLVGVSWTSGEGRFATLLTPSSVFPPIWDMLDPNTWDFDTSVELDAFTVVQGANSSENSSEGLYMAHQLSAFDDRFKVVGGIRWHRTSSATYPIVNDVRTSGPEFDVRATTPQVGAGFKLRRDIMLYANYSESFVPQSRFLRIQSVPGPAAEPLVGQGWETGIKTDFFGGRISSTLAYFDIEEGNSIQTSIVVNPITSITEITDTQGGKVRSTGWEFELNLTLTDAWQVYASWTDNDVRISESPVDPTLVGVNPINSVRSLYSVWTRYDFKTGPLAGFHIGGGVSHTGRKAFRGIDNPALFQPAYELVDIMAGYSWQMGDQQWRLTFNWKNATSVEYFPTWTSRGQPRRLLATCTITF